jgi:hypothetical protein
VLALNWRRVRLAAPFWLKMQPLYQRIAALCALSVLAGHCVS